MSMMKMYLTDSLYLNAEQIAEDFYIVHLLNGKQIEVTENPTYNGNVWGWKIDSQFFDRDDWALNYLKKLIAEKLTGKRIILHKKYEVPDICQYRCRAEGECNRALCDRCPIAEAFFAARDGVELVYAV